MKYLFYTLTTIKRKVNKLTERKMDDEWVVKNIGRFIPLRYNDEHIQKFLDGDFKLEYTEEEVEQKNKIEELINIWVDCGHSNSKTARKCGYTSATASNYINDFVERFYREYAPIVYGRKNRYKKITEKSIKKRRKEQGFTSLTVYYSKDDSDEEKRKERVIETNDYLYSALYDTDRKGKPKLNPKLDITKYKDTYDTSKPKELKVKNIIYTVKNRYIIADKKYYVISNKGDKSVGLINDKGDKLIDVKYIKIQYDRESGLFIVKDKTGYGAYNLKLKWILPCIYVDDNFTEIKFTM